MARVARPWFRFYVEAMSDPKLRTLHPTTRWIWVALLGAARQSPDPGYLLVSEDVPHTAQSLADFAAVKGREATEAMREFELRGMIEQDMERSCWVVSHFSERQYESDNSTSRTQSHRSHTVSENGNGTRPENRDRRQRPPDSFAPTDEHRSYALEHALDLVEERAHWLDWCAANGKTYASINAAFSTWLRQAVRFGRGGKPVATLEELATPRVVDKPVWVCTAGVEGCVDGWVDSERPGRVNPCECRVR